MQLKELNKYENTYQSYLTACASDGPHPRHSLLPSLASWSSLIVISWPRPIGPTMSVVVMESLLRFNVCLKIKFQTVFVPKHQNVTCRLSIVCVNDSISDSWWDFKSERISYLLSMAWSKRCRVSIFKVSTFIFWNWNIISFDLYNNHFHYKFYLLFEYNFLCTLHNSPNLFL